MRRNGKLAKEKYKNTNFYFIQGQIGATDPTGEWLSSANGWRNTETCCLIALISMKLCTCGRGAAIWQPTVKRKCKIGVQEECTRSITIWCSNLSSTVHSAVSTTWRIIKEIYNRKCDIILLYNNLKMCRNSRVVWKQRTRLVNKYKHFSKNSKWSHCNHLCT